MSGTHPLGERSAGVPAPLAEAVPVDSFAGKVEVRWTPEEAVTPLGQLPFFVDSLKQADLFDPFVGEAPLQYTSPTAPRVRDVLGTLLLSVASGRAATRMSTRGAGTGSMRVCWGCGGCAATIRCDGRSAG